MSTYVLMKILESAPNRYDTGIRILMLGRITKVYDRVALLVEKDQKVLDIGCGTGALSIRAARKGAFVKGIDINPQMLEVAMRNAREAGITNRVEFAEMSVVELDREESECYDVVMSGLCFSELSFDEVTFTLTEIKRILKTNGLLIIADEVVPRNLFKRICVWILRFPLAALTYLITQTRVHAIRDLESRVQSTGFQIKEIRRNYLGDFIQLVSVKTEKGEA